MFLRSEDWQERSVMTEFVSMSATAVLAVPVLPVGVHRAFAQVLVVLDHDGHLGT